MENSLLVLRREQKSRKPEFIRQRYHTKACLGRKWRKPRQKHSKLRRCKRGHRQMPSPGYGSPSAVRGFDRSGLKPVVVSNSDQLLKLQKGEGAVISSSVGAKKRLALVEQAIKKNIMIINIKDLKKFVEDAKKAFEERIEKKKQMKKEAKKTKTEAKKEEAKKEVREEKKAAAKKEPKAEETTEKEKQLEEKKEKDKVLTQK